MTKVNCPFCGDLHGVDWLAHCLGGQALVLIGEISMRQVQPAEAARRLRAMADSTDQAVHAAEATSGTKNPGESHELAASRVERSSVAASICSGHREGRVGSGSRKASVTNSKGLSSAESGDFQTPLDVARTICRIVKRAGLRPLSIVEPTCGTGAFVQAAIEIFPEATEILAVDANPLHVERVKQSVAPLVRPGLRLSILEKNFFSFDWCKHVSGLPRPLLILGNPPWVTSAALGAIGSENLPDKRNIDGLRGIEALTGRSNFDISEWMLRESLDWICGGVGMMAVLCKTSVARKVLVSTWKTRRPIGPCATYAIDARGIFDASVDACLLVLHAGSSIGAMECDEYSSLESLAPTRRIALRDAHLVADLEKYDRWVSLLSRGAANWRSGVKHDCSKLFELTRDGDQFVNGLGERVSLEPDRVFPLLKSSDLARGRRPRRWLALPQFGMSDEPVALARAAPIFWAYLERHGALLDKRASSIYRNRPRFSIFGVGPYSFAMWKVAISGLYKSLRFALVPPHEGRPVMLDDTCYFYPCSSEDEARSLMVLLGSNPALEFLTARIFWDAKRPITAALLNSLDLPAVAQTLGMDAKVCIAFGQKQRIGYGNARQPTLF